MKTYRLIADLLDDEHAHEISFGHSMKRRNIIDDCFAALTLSFDERLYLKQDGSHESVRTFMENKLAELREFINGIVSEPDAEIAIDLGYNLTGLFAAYYAVIASPRVDVHLMTLPAFGGDSVYAKTHPLLIRKLIYNVLNKARRIYSPVPDGEKVMRELYPRFERAFETELLFLPATYVPTYDFVREGIAVFTEFEPGGGIDRALAALHKVARVRPSLVERSVTILGPGNIDQAGSVSAAFPNWKVVFNPPLREYVNAAAKAEVVILPDDPPHAGPTKELFAAIGAGAAIVAHEDGAAGAYAGKGALTFGSEGDAVLRLANAILRVAADPADTFRLMEATVERRNALRNAIPALTPAADLDSPTTEARD